MPVPTSFSEPFLPLGLVALSCMLVGHPGRADTTTSSLPSSASVVATCRLSTTSLSFGVYDPIGTNVASDKIATSVVNVTCTDGASTTITFDGGNSPASGSTNALPLRRMTDGSVPPNHLSYFLYQDAAHTSAWGNSAMTGKTLLGSGVTASISVYGVIPAGQQLPAGSYSDLVMATVTF